MKTNGIVIGLLLSAGVLIMSVANGFSQNLLTDGSFESPAVTSATKVDYPTSLSQWHTTATNFEIWTNGWRNPAAGLGPLDSIDGNQNLEILSEGTNVTVSQSLPTVVGERYHLSFYYSPRPNSSSDKFVVAVNSNQVFSAIEDGAGLTNFDWQRFTTNFVADSNSTTVAFSDTSLTGGGSGTHIDGVVVKHVPRLTIENIGTGLNVSWFTVSNETYQLQAATNLTTGNWNNLGLPITGFDATNTILVIPPPAAVQAFYQIEVGQ